VGQIAHNPRTVNRSKTPLSPDSTHLPAPTRRRMGNHTIAPTNRVVSFLAALREYSISCI
jgi:hypothetical protein